MGIGTYPEMPVIDEKDKKKKKKKRKHKKGRKKMKEMISMTREREREHCINLGQLGRFGLQKRA